MGDLEDVLDAGHSPLDVARALGLKVKSGSRRVVVSCPWHNEKNPSCVLAERDGRVLAHCFSCHSGGSVIELVGAVRGAPTKGEAFPAALRLTAEVLGVTLRKRGEKTRPQPARVAPSRTVELAMALDEHGERWLHGKPEQSLPPMTRVEHDAAMLVLLEADAQDAREVAGVRERLDRVAPLVLEVIALREAEWNR